MEGWTLVKIWGPEAADVRSKRLVPPQEFFMRSWQGVVPLCLVLYPSPGTEGVGAALPLPSSHGRGETELGRQHEVRMDESGKEGRKEESRALSLTLRGEGTGSKHSPVFVTRP